MNGMMLQIKAERLEHCPQGQLEKATGGSIGWDILSADSIYVPTYSELVEWGKFTWELVGPLTTFSEEQQEDIRACTSIKVEGDQVYRRRYEPFLVRTGIKLIPYDRCWFILAPRSSTGARYLCNLIHGIGVIDPDYNDELLVPIIANAHPQIFKRGEKIAQLMLLPWVPAEVQREVPVDNEYYDEYGGAIRAGGSRLLGTRTGGFGSTGI